MAELLTPGVIIQEVPFGPQPIEGVSTSTAGFVGETLFGPTEGPPTLVTSFPDFQRKFGGLIAGKTLGYAIQGFFDNGGRRAYVARVAGAGATAGSLAVPNDGFFVALVGSIAAAGAALYKLSLSSVTRVEVGADSLTILDRTGAEPPVSVSVVAVDGMAGVVTIDGGPSLLGANAAPFALVPNDALGISVDGDAAVDATFLAASATLVSVGEEPFSLSGQELNVVVNGVPEVVTFAAETTAAAVALAIQTQVPELTAAAVGATVRITTVLQGSDASLHVTGGTANSQLDFPTTETAPTASNVANIAAVSVAEVKAVVEAALAGVVVSDVDGHVRLARSAPGPTASLQVSASSAATAFGLALTVATGVDLTGRTGGRYYAQVDGPAGSAPSLTLAARDRGSFSSRLSCYVEPYYAASRGVGAKIDADEYDLANVDGLVVGDAVELRLGADRHAATLSTIDPATRRVTLNTGSIASFTGGRCFSVKWRVQVLFDGVVVETLDGLSTQPTAFNSAIAERSAWVRVTSNMLNIAVDTGFPAMALASPLPFVGGLSAAPAESDVVGTTLDPRSGLGSIEGRDGINMIAAPGFTSQVVVNALISQAERLQDRFAVFESQDQADVNDVLIQRGLYNSQYAAMYHPWLRVRDPLSGSNISLPPSGHVLGAYARTDNDRGVFKAPANVVLRGVLSFTRDVSTGEQDVLNPQGVNVLRRFDGLGLVIWGARTISADSLWKYVPVRRLFIFLEQSIVRGTRYAVFEPNGTPLWARIRDSVTNFLTTQWRSGALFGRTPAEAFFVRVDETTTTQDDRDNGRVNILVGIAPVKPAEFVVFQIGQAPSSVIIAEQG